MASSSSVPKMPCKNDPEYQYSGKEQSPLGLGYTAEGEAVGTVMDGRDKNKWIVGVKNGVKVWSKIPASSPPTPKKEEPVMPAGSDSPVKASASDDITKEITAAIKDVAITPKKKATAPKKTVTKKIKDADAEKDASDTASTTSSKGKRAVSDFNIYMKYRLAQLKEEGGTSTHRERFSQAASEWKGLDPKEKEGIMLKAREYYTSA